MSGPITWNLDGHLRNGVEFWMDWAKGADWRFGSYYKYTFTFAASGELLIRAPGQAETVPFTASATAGGDSGDIYRWHVADPMTWGEICQGGGPGFTIRSEGGVLFSTHEHLMPKRDEDGAIAT